MVDIVFCVGEKYEIISLTTGIFIPNNSPEDGKNPESELSVDTVLGVFITVVGSLAPTCVDVLNVIELAGVVVMAEFVINGVVSIPDFISDTASPEVTVPAQAASLALTSLFCTYIAPVPPYNAPYGPSIPSADARYASAGR